MIVADECFLSINGTFRRHLGVPQDAGGESAYSIFDMYGQWAGWSSNDVRAEGDVLWHMHEAGENWSDTTTLDTRNIMWAQVGLSTRSKIRGLPIFELCSCTDLTLRCVGQYTVTGFQTITPSVIESGEKTRDLSPLFNVLNSNATHRTELSIEIDLGSSEIDSDLYSSLFTSLKFSESLNLVTITDTRIEPALERPLIEEPGEMSREVWLGKSVDRIVADALVPEFTLQTCAYLVQEMSRALKVNGFGRPALISIAVAE